MEKNFSLNQERLTDGVERFTTTSADGQLTVEATESSLRVNFLRVLPTSKIHGETYQDRLQGTQEAIDNLLKKDQDIAFQLYALMEPKLSDEGQPQKVHIRSKHTDEVGWQIDNQSLTIDAMRDNARTNVTRLGHESLRSQVAGTITEVVNQRHEARVKLFQKVLNDSEQKAKRNKLAKAVKDRLANRMSLRYRRLAMAVEPLAGQHFFEAKREADLAIPCFG